MTCEGSSAGLARMGMATTEHQAPWMRRIAPTSAQTWQDHAPVEPSSTRRWSSDAVGAGGSCATLVGRIDDSQISYRTRLGVQAVGDSRQLLDLLPKGSVDLIVTSPPFALLRRKAYGNEDQADYVAWLLEFGKAAHRVLKDTGSFVLDIGGAYQRGVPVRSLYPYRVLLGFCDDLGYHLAEEFHWHNPSKLPSPIEWVNKRKIRVKDSVNNVFWFSKTEWPKADISRVRQPYSARMRLLLKDPAAYYDPKNRPSGHGISGRFGQDNGGSLPSNLLSIPNSGSSSRFQKLCKELSEPVHPARFPGGLPQFFIRMLTDPGDVVLDIFSGSNTTGEMAEAEGRRWLGFELDRDYACLSALRFIPEVGALEARRALKRLRLPESLHILGGAIADDEPYELAGG
jgi:DNA modification methylase